MNTDHISKINIMSAIASGMLLTASFPKIELQWLAWFALVPLLISLRKHSFKESFKLGLLAGFVHFFTLLHWLVYTMRAYGNLPLYLSVTILFLFSFYLAVYIALFSAVLVRIGKKPVVCCALIPVLWVSQEYLRSFIFSGFPWELLGYSQYKALNLIQISDIFGVYGVSFLIALSNAVIFFGFLSLTRKAWQGKTVNKRQVMGPIIVFGIFFALVWFYGSWRIRLMDRMVLDADFIRATVIQGNIDQAKKWDPAFQEETVKKYINYSLSGKKHQPDLIVWPETATPFYFLHNPRLSDLVKRGVEKTGTSFLIGSPSFRVSNNGMNYYNSAYLIDPDGQVTGKYNKVHLVPFGEYVPFKKWLPFLEKIVAQVGDFKPGKKGTAIEWGKHKIGTLICFEIIFPMLSRAMSDSGSSLLVNITNDAWFGESGGPYQHFSMAIFRAVENRKSLIRSANTGISGFVDPAGRIIARTPLCKEAVMTRKVPIINKMTFYTRYGNLFAVICLGASLIFFIKYHVVIFKN